MSTFTTSDSTSFTLTHARHLASKVATDLKRMQRFYGQPTDARIADFETELTELLRFGYVDEVSYGFRRGGFWIQPSLHYTASDLAGGSATNDDPGRIRPNANVSGAHFSSFLSYSDAWFALSALARASFERALPISRADGVKPGVSGRLVRDLTYSSGGRALGRSSVLST